MSDQPQCVTVKIAVAIDRNGYWSAAGNCAYQSADEAMQAALDYLPQESAPVADETVIELATAISPEMAQLQRRLKEFAANPDADTHDYHEVQARFDELGGYQLEAKAKQILAGLSFREKDFERPAREMSGGWVMRAHLARLLVMEPDLLLLDEPSTGLDPGVRLELWDHLQTIRRDDGVTVVMTTHLLEEADKADRIALVDQGRLVAVASPDELRSTVGGDSIVIERAMAADLPPRSVVARR